MKNSTTYFTLILCLLLVTSCQYFKQTENQKVIAKAGNNFLYEEDIPTYIYDQQTPEDSLANLNQFIEKWALKNILLENAKFNLPKKKQEEFDRMAKEYQIQLYINAYKDALIEKKLNFDVNQDSIAAYYDKNKQNFKLKEELIKLRYLIVKNDLKDIDVIKDKFFSYTEEDKEYLENKNLEFKALILNDSVWVRALDIKRQIPEVQDDFEKYMNSTTFAPIVFKDSTYSYMFHVKDKLNTNEIPPITYLKSTIIQILENKRKLELNKELEKNILNDAIQSNDFKTY